MREIPAKRDPKRCPTHPGTVLRDDVLPAVKRTKIEIAELLGISRQQLNAILRAKKPISPTIAARVGKLFGTGPPGCGSACMPPMTRGDTSKIPTIKAA